jgi:hypothetical protein
MVDSAAPGLNDPNRKLISVVTVKGFRGREQEFRRPRARERSFRQILVACQYLLTIPLVVDQGVSDYPHLSGSGVQDRSHCAAASRKVCDEGVCDEGVCDEGWSAALRRYVHGL